ncbi:Calx-beta domain-containing protein [Roseivirga sp.]|uniref:Calx-beta domain-containing protein n=1 Tax=Roseivirga sp. TaxID=1964215 RepID=UPI003B8ADE95
MRRIAAARGIYFLCLMLFISAALMGQTGPGGVGSSANNIIWLKADEITGLADGADVLTWSDFSGNGNTLTQPNSIFSPVFQSGEINGLPVVRFNKTNGRIRRTGFSGFPTSAITAIYVNKTTDSGDGILSYASSSSNNDFLLFRSENLNFYRGTNIASGVSINDNAFHITNAAWRNSDGSVEVWKDGSQDFSTSGFRTGTSITAGGSFAVAGEQDSQDGGYASSQAHFGDFSEVMVFDTYLNEAQHIIIANYLSAKYALSISNDRYDYQSSHPNEVAGIGREDASNTHTSAMSADIFRVEGADGLDANQEYLLFGHDGGDATTAWTTTEAPNSGVNIQRLAREWRFDETGTVGNIDIVIDVNDLPTLPADYTVYALMVDSDGDFSSGASVYELVLSAGTEYSYAGYDINDGDYMAIAAVRPVIEHTLTSNTGAESLSPTIEVTLNFIPATSRTAEVTTSDISTTVGDDYTALSGTTVTITAGNATATYSVTVIDDMDEESNESLLITLANPTAGLNIGDNDEFTYTIEDNDQVRKVYFDAASSSGSETVLSVNVGLSISLVDMTNPTSVDYEVTGGTATGGGTDYTLAAGTVTFAPGITTGSFNIDIIDDGLFELDETLIITLSNPVNSNLDNTMPFAGTGAVTHTYTIVNDDVAPQIQFNSTAASGSETITAVAFQVDLSTVSGTDASATYTVSMASTATGGGSDYTLADGTITISEGNTTANINATIIDDSNEELSETLIITLSLPINASLGSNTTFTYTIINNSVIGFTGPGGVGQASSNILWNRPEELSVVSDGTDITIWPDFSGNGNDLEQADLSFTPRYFTNILNNQPVARFQQSNGRLVKTNFSQFPTDQITTVIVNATNETSDDGLLSYASSASDNDFLLFSTNNLRLFRANTNTSSGVAINGGGFNISTATWQTSGAVSVWKNGSEDYTTTGFQTGTAITNNGALAIGAEQDGVNSGYDAAQDHLGDFAEVAIYNLVLNEAQTIIVQNYLSAKYNITLSTNDIYKQDDFASGDFDHEVAGIGRIGASNLHVDAKGSGIVRVNNVQDLDDEEFLLWGHNNSELRATSTDVPMGISRRLERVWRVSEVNRSNVSVDVGAIDISFDLAGLGNVELSDLVLLIDSDGTFNAGAIEVSGALDDGGDSYRFSNVTAITDGLYFTLATLDKQQTPLPVELISFAGELTSKNEVYLTWETASEVDNSHFDIERSFDGITFETIGTVAGNGQSDSVNYYEFLDKNLANGRNYYRLKQVDFNGVFDYSEIVSIFFEGFREADYERNKIYPNPIDRGKELQIAYSSRTEQSLTIHIFDRQGTTVLAKDVKVLTGENLLLLNTNRLTQGLYIIRISEADRLIQTFKLIIK